MLNRFRLLLLLMLIILLACFSFFIFASIDDAQRQHAQNQAVRQRAQSAESLLFFTCELSELMRYTYEIPSRAFLPPAQQTKELLRLTDKYRRALTRVEKSIAWLDAIRWDDPRREATWRQARREWQRLEIWQSGIAAEIEVAARAKQVQLYPVIYQKVVDRTLEMRHVFNTLQSRTSDLAHIAVRESLTESDEESLFSLKRKMGLFISCMLLVCVLAWAMWKSVRKALGDWPQAQPG